MGAHRRWSALALASGVGLLLASAIAPPASATRHDPGSGVQVVATGLDDPYGLDAQGRGFVVAENLSGQVTHVDRNGSQRVLLSGAGGVAGVADGLGRTFAVLGGPDETGAPPAGDYPPSSVLRLRPWGGKATRIADLLQYEIDHNPDGQVQFDPDGNPYDALSNPFSMNLSRYGLLVADGGANDVLRVDPRTGRRSTFFVPPTVTDVPACLAPEAQANPGTVGCDPVPTGVAVANGSVYVSTLGAEVPGAGRVYQLNPWTGKVRHVWKGLTAPTGIAVDRDGTIYVSEVLYNAPEGDQPPPGFDPSTVGRITRIDCNGRITHAAVTMPIGLLIRDGRLYSTAWSLAGAFLGQQGAGQIVSVDRRAFH